MIKPNSPLKSNPLRSILSISTFIFLVIGVGFLSVNFILALIHKFSSIV